MGASTLPLGMEWKSHQAAKLGRCSPSPCYAPKPCLCLLVLKVETRSLFGAPDILLPCCCGLTASFPGKPQRFWRGLGLRPSQENGGQRPQMQAPCNTSSSFPEKREILRIFDPETSSTASKDKIRCQGTNSDCFLQSEDANR